jgi:hypothetical protein
LATRQELAGRPAWTADLVPNNWRSEWQVPVILFPFKMTDLGWEALVDCDHHSIFGSLVLAAVGMIEHIVAHMCEDEPFGPQLVKVCLNRVEAEVCEYRLVAKIGLGDKQVGIERSWD